MPERLNRLEAILSGKRWDLAFRLHSFLPPRKSLQAGVLAFALLLVAIALKFIVDDLAGGRLPPFIFLYPAVVIAALIAGARRGAIIAVLSILVAWLWFLPPLASFALASETALLSLEIYAASAIFLALTVGFARHTLDIAIASEELRDYDAQEAIHRIKNLLAVVQAITTGTLNDTESLEDYRKLISKRLRALAGAQDVLRRRGVGPVTVEDLAHAALSPFLPNSQITIECAAGVHVPERYVHGLTLALFELATNSAKYGALSRDVGEIGLTCQREGATVILEWRETAAPDDREIAPEEENEGFGGKLIQVALRRDEGTDVSHRQCDEGVIATFRWSE